jgi:hypothetical protein
MKNTSNIISARTDFEDLEDLGWDFSDLYEGVAAANEMSIEAAEAWEKENYHVYLSVEDSWVYWQPCHNESGLEGDRQSASHSQNDNEESLRHMQFLYENAGLWEVETEDDDN